jgi:transglutaminase/protease-like cytokinesis protein 3
MTDADLTNIVTATQTTAPETTTVLTTTTSVTSTPAETEKTETVSDITQDMIYNELLKSAEQYRYSFSIDGCVEIEDIDPAFQRFNDDYPEYFWVRNYRYSTNGRLLKIELDTFQDCKPEQLKEMYTEMTAESERILSLIPAGSSEYDKALFVHDYLIDHTDFDYQRDDLPNADEYRICHTSYGCIVKGSAVCEGYSRAFQYLMKRLSIPCGTCCGIAGGERHAWNYIKLDGDYYWADLTWDDPNSLERPGEHSISHAYFLLDDEMLGRSHTVAIENLFVPKCTETKLNYFIQNGLYFHNYALSDIDKYLTNNRVEIMFSNESAYLTAIQKLFLEGEIWKTTLLENRSAEINYSKKDDVFVIAILIE